MHTYGVSLGPFDPRWKMQQRDPALQLSKFAEYCNGSGDADPADPYSMESAFREDDQGGRAGYFLVRGNVRIYFASHVATPCRDDTNDLQWSHSLDSPLRNISPMDARLQLHRQDRQRLFGGNLLLPHRRLPFVYAPTGSALYR